MRSPESIHAGTNPRTHGNAGTSAFGWIYLISDGGWYAKIGFARNPEKRLALLQTGSPEQLRIIGVIDGQRWVESDLHELFASDRVRGEWFRRTPELKAYFEDHGFVCVCDWGTVEAECFIHGEGLPPW